MTQVWIAANHGDLGGGEVMAVSLARAARDLGYDARIAAPSHPARMIALARAEGFATAEIHGRSASRYAVNLAAWDLAERQGVLWANGLRAAAATAGHRNRIVHLHQVPRRRQRWVARAASWGARAVVVPSEFASRSVPGATVLPNWTQPFDEPRFDRRLVRGDAASPVVLGFLGRLSTLKGVDVLARALTRLDRQEPGRYRLLLAGEPTYVGDHDRAAVETALEPVAPLVDRPGRLTPREFFARVDLAVFPSVVPEAFGLVVAEAMSVGCPFVISGAGALPEVAGGHPYVAEPGDDDSLADAVRRAASGYPATVVRAAFERWRVAYSPAAGTSAMGSLLRGLGIEP